MQKTSRRNFLSRVTAVATSIVLGSGLIRRFSAKAYAATESYDVIVVGSGAAGMTAALVAAKLGLSVLLIEKAPYFGGSTARSGGGIWIRNNRITKEAGVHDSPEEAEIYLAQVAGSEVSQAKQRAFLKAGPEMIDFILENTPLRFRWMEGYSDYYPELFGGKAEGASIEPQIFDGRILGDELKRLNPPYIPTPAGVVIFGGDYKWLCLVKVSIQGAKTAARAVSRYVEAKLKRQKPLTMGQALAAGLRAGLLRAGVPVWLNTPLVDLSISSEGRVEGVIAKRNGIDLTLKARYGVILASGGFEHNAAMRQLYQKQPISTAWTLGAKANTGDGILVGQRLGADLLLMDDAWWGPTIPLTPDSPYFCLSERSLPGSILVNAEARRFVNESSPYHDVVNAMYQQPQRQGELPIFLVTDQQYRDRYLFKDILPGLDLPKAWYESGALVKADSLAELAQRLGLPAAALEETVAEFNAFADQGYDAAFQRGESAYDRYYADPSRRPNPSLGGLTKAPYYAFRVVPGDLGTKGGLRTDEFSRVLRSDGSVIAGLYAAGNVSDSVMGHSYAGAGSTLGPAMTFGYIAAQQIKTSLEQSSAI